jgi:hypothetical protein
LRFTTGTFNMVGTSTPTSSDILRFSELFFFFLVS